MGLRFFFHQFQGEFESGREIASPIVAKIGPVEFKDLCSFILGDPFAQVHGSPGYIPVRLGNRNPVPPQPQDLAEILVHVHSHFQIMHNRMTEHTFALNPGDIPLFYKLSNRLADVDRLVPVFSARISSVSSLFCPGCIYFICSRISSAIRLYLGDPDSLNTRGSMRFFILSFQLMAGHHQPDLLHCHLFGINNTDNLTTAHNHKPIGEVHQFFQLCGNIKDCRTLLSLLQYSFMNIFDGPHIQSPGGMHGRNGPGFPWSSRARTSFC